MNVTIDQNHLVKVKLCFLLDEMHCKLQTMGSKQIENFTFFQFISRQARDIALDNEARKSRY